ncbi:MAG: type IV pilus biogenesis/stability protein PilW [Methylococcaceae bacterium]
MQPRVLKQFNRIIICLLPVLLIACASPTKKKESADVYLQLGVRYLSMNRLEAAKENLERALQYEPDNFQAHNVLAFLYEKIEKYPEAKAHYKTALNLSPDDLGVQNNYGRFLCEQGEFDEGMALLSKAIANLLNDRAWLALTNAGLCQMDMGQKQKAKTFFKQALQLNENYAPALLEMLKLSYQNGEYWPAKGFLQRYAAASAHTSESLWFAMQTEKALGNESEAREYQNLLLEKFPFSNEAKQFGSVRH